MGFIDSYKRLEKLCGELLNDNRRVSAYIDEMLATPRGSYLVSGWDEDLKQLKHYRWIRNQIVHDPGCNEENMCSNDDTQWIESFYNRIINQTDPLALYRSVTQSRHTHIRKNNGSQHYQESKPDNSQRTQNQSGCGMLLLITVTVIVIAILWILKG